VQGVLSLPRRKGLARWTVAAIVVLGLAWVVELVSIVQLHDVTIEGAVTLTPATASRSSSLSSPGSPCALPAFRDLHRGTPITVSDGHHTVIARSSLHDGRPDRTGLHCVLTFRIRAVPPGVPSYIIQIGHRAAIRVAAAQATNRLSMSFQEPPSPRPSP
jgi:hypothetical protein